MWQGGHRRLEEERGRVFQWWLCRGGKPGWPRGTPGGIAMLMIEMDEGTLRRHSVLSHTLWVFCLWWWWWCWCRLPQLGRQPGRHPGCPSEQIYNELTSCMIILVVKYNDDDEQGWWWARLMISPKEDFPIVERAELAASLRCFARSEHSPCGSFIMIMVVGW